MSEQEHTVFILVFAVMLWLTEAVPPFAVGLFIIVSRQFTVPSRIPLQ